MKRFLQDTFAAPCSQKKTKHAATGSCAALQDTSWKHFKAVERAREASDSSWYLATCSFCAHAGQLRLKTDRSSSRARAHLDCIAGQSVRNCSLLSTCRQKSEISYFGQPIVVGTARLLDNSQHTLRDAFTLHECLLGLYVCDNRDGWLVAWGLCGCMLSRFSTVWLLLFTLLYLLRIARHDRA